MTAAVFLAADASRDLENIYDYIDSHDAPGKANRVLARIEKTFLSLSELPERGRHPKELLALGIREYREVFFKPYRIIYSIRDDKVYILLIADGRRDMEALLQNRLLGY